MIISTVQQINQLVSEPDRTPYELHVNGFEIRTLTIVKYLGSLVDDWLTWEHHIKYITKKQIESLAF